MIQDINKLIKSYEPLMHKLLKKFKVKRDYEDIMQELRMVVWKATETYIEKDDKGSAKFFTYVYRAMVNQLQTILKINYRIPPNCENIEELEIKDKLAYYMENPAYYEDLPIDEQLTVIADASSAEDIKARLDFDLFYSLLSKDDKKLVKLSGQGFTQEEISKRMNYSQQTVSKKLKGLKKTFKNFISNGGNYGKRG